MEIAKATVEEAHDVSYEDRRILSKCAAFIQGSPDRFREVARMAGLAIKVQQAVRARDTLAMWYDIK